jgi:hypothetical protein
MKRLALFVTVALVAGTAVVWAQSQEQDSIIGSPLGVTLKAKLSDGTSVTEATLGGNLSLATVELLNLDPGNGHTNCAATFNVIGSSLGTSNYVDTVNQITNTVISGMLLADTADVDLSKGKAVATFGQESAVIRGNRSLRCGECDPIPGFAVDQSVLTTSTWTIVSSLKTSNNKTSFVGQVTGVWKDGSTAFKGSLKNVK